MHVAYLSNVTLEVVVASKGIKGTQLHPASTQLLPSVTYKEKEMQYIPPKMIISMHTCKILNY